MVEKYLFLLLLMYHVFAGALPGSIEVKNVKDGNQ